MNSRLPLLLAFFQNRRESKGFYLDDVLGDVHASRRFIEPYDDEGTVLGSPTRIRHLPEAEELLPGHTLLRPALGMLKSAVKFPHRDMLDGSGVYGNYGSIGMTWDGTNDRVINTGFRRRHSRRDDSLVNLKSK